MLDYLYFIDKGNSGAIATESASRPACGVRGERALLPGLQKRGVDKDSSRGKTIAQQVG